MRMYYHSSCNEWETGTKLMIIDNPSHYFIAIANMTTLRIKSTRLLSGWDYVSRFVTESSLDIPIALLYHYLYFVALMGSWPANLLYRL